jgi:hypothetical protein
MSAYGCNCGGGFGCGAPKLGGLGVFRDAAALDPSVIAAVDTPTATYKPNYWMMLAVSVTAGVLVYAITRVMGRKV